MAAVSGMRYDSMLTASGYYGAGAIAGRRGIVTRPAPGRSGLLALLQQTFSPSEVRSRFSGVLFEKRPDDSVLSSMIRNSDVQSMVVVVRGYGQSITHFFRNLGPGGGIAPARSVVSRAGADTINRIAGVPTQEQKNRLRRSGAEADYRNLNGAGYTREEMIQVNSVLSDHTDWGTFSGFHAALTSNMPARFTRLHEVSGKDNDNQIWEYEGKRISLERGLFVVVANGFRPDGTAVPSGQKAERSTYLGRRVDVIPSVRADEYIERLKREWGLIMLADAGVRIPAGRAAVEAAIARGCPIDISSKGIPLARMVYDRNMVPGSSILLAAPYLGFMDRGRSPDGKPTLQNPDVLEEKFGEKWNAYQKRIAPVAAQAVRPPRPTSSGNSDAAIHTFSLAFRETCKDIRPSDTAIVFSGGSSRNFSLVHRTTGDIISDIPLIALSNLPDGKYVRIRSDNFEEWKKPVREKRNSLSSVSSGFVTVSDGVLSHFNAAEQLHNDYNGPSVVKAAAGPDGSEITPAGVSWHDNGNNMREQEFLNMRHVKSVSAKTFVPESNIPEESGFGFAPDETPAAVRHG